MTRRETQDRIAALLEGTGKAHHQAFLATDGADPEWAIWYAKHLQGPLHDILDIPFTVTELTRTLSELAEAYQAKAPTTPWAAFYAGEIVARHVAQEGERLALYYFRGCPFCTTVQRTIDRLGIEVELRDIHASDQHFEDLVAARGRPTVPVLRCTAGDVDRWMPESRDIVAYLERRFGSPA